MAHLVFLVFLIAAGAAMIVMIGVALSTKTLSLEQSTVQPRAYALRRWWFWILGFVAVASFIISIPSFPYPSRSTALARKHFSIVAEQYAFLVPDSVPLNTPLMFDVTAKDVNHGFGIYDPDNVLVSQVQAMPDYVNHLAVTLSKRGNYTIRCLEYCGIGHASMQAHFEVK